MSKMQGTESENEGAYCCCSRCEARLLILTTALLKKGKVLPSVLFQPESRFWQIEIHPVVDADSRQRASFAVYFAVVPVREKADSPGLAFEPDFGIFRIHPRLGSITPFYLDNGFRKDLSDRPVILQRQRIQVP